MPTRSRTTDGVLLVDKPVGATSHDIVTAARRHLQTRRIGHGGTLDPFATGLLVLLTGRATRLLPYLEGEPKVYEATVAFGAETTTDDLTGDIVREAPLPAPQRVDAALANLTGRFDQLPPSFSAKQVGGVRAYRAARRGKPLTLEPVSVTVHAWDVVERSDEGLRAIVTCSGGTYIRALARDIGRQSESAAHLTALRRLASGVFRVADASRPEDWADGGARLLSMRSVIPSMPVQQLDDSERMRVLHGNPLAPAVDGERVALIDSDGELVAIAERIGDKLQPRVVLSDA